MYNVHVVAVIPVWAWVSRVLVIYVYCDIPIKA